MFKCINVTDQSNQANQINENVDLNPKIQFDLAGIVYDVIHEPSKNTLYITIQFKSKEFLCRYKYTEYYPIMKNDKVIMSGENTQINFQGKDIEVFDIHIITARYEFDLASFISDNLIDHLNSESIKNLATNIQTYSEEFYGAGIDGVIDCLNTMFENIKNESSILSFANYIFGSDPTNNVRNTKKLLCRYNDDAVKRPLQLLGMNEEEIKVFTISLLDVYKIAKENPFRIPEISKDRANYIVKNHLRMESVPDEWEKCGNICRYVYDSLMQRGWTSIPTSKMKAAFPYSFDDHKALVLKEYFCKEDMEYFYFSPILKIEKIVSKVISKLITSEQEIKYVPFYAGVEPSEEQSVAVEGSLNKRISIITGGAGTGKTEIIGSVCDTLIKHKSKPLCVAFTGVAAQRIKESLGKKGIVEECNVMTIHGAIAHMNDLAGDSLTHVIFDEFSMVDLKLFYEFINCYSIVYNLSYIFVGDINQLEPIDYGNVMEQFLKTSIPIYRLTKNFRSEIGIISLISDVVDPKRFADQKGIQWSRDCSDYTFYRGNLQTVIDFIQFQFDNYKGITLEDFLEFRDRLTIVSPLKKVVNEINIEFQRIFMNDFDFVEIDGVKYHIHDRVMKLINNHNISVMNGEKGKIIEINKEYIVVKFRENKNQVLCPFLGKNFLRSVKTIHKDIRYSPYKIVDGIKIPKELSLIEKELIDLKKETKPAAIKNIKSQDLDNYFDIAIKYPFEIFSMTFHSEFLSIKSITLAYAITTHKSQGDQYPVCLYYVPSQTKNFVTYKNVYTGLSRAREQLIVMAENELVLNMCILTRGSFKYDNLSSRINSLLPVELQVVQETLENQIDEIEDGGVNTFIDDDLDW
jgi:hypothetical protein